MSKQQSPILNSPYEEPRWHYATDGIGNLNYQDVREGRRVFAPDVPQIPLQNRLQNSLFDINDNVAEYREHLVNQLRTAVTEWRKSEYSGVTSRVTLDLLRFWFLNPERQSWQKLFFPQQEAVETAIWLNEVAEKSNSGTHILNQIVLAQATVSDSIDDQLPRLAFKMATGTGKTVVMACLILYHFLNRQEYRNDTRFADDFLVVAPGITIRDRLTVLIPDTQDNTPHTANDYYRQRVLVPPQYSHLIESLGAHLVITNYHAFEPRQLSGNKKNPFDGKRDAEGNKQQSFENPALVLKRVLGKFKTGRRLLVLNDEAHHCYLPRIRGKNVEDENIEEENARAAVWFSGLREISRAYKVRVIYDLSATPYYLSGSGYPPYSFFPWVVSDFGLIEAIEAGLVKIPFLPVDDSTQQIDEPILKNLYDHCKAELPKKGQRGQKKADKKEGKQTLEEKPNLPKLVRTALDQFVAHYQKYEQGLREKGEKALDLFSEPPVFIVVCNNTTVSKEVYKHIAGFEMQNADGTITVYPGMFDIFSNYDPTTRIARIKPPTLLIDSDALENSGQIDESFKKIFAPEIEQFKREYRIRHPEKSADKIDEVDILREVVNTVGKPRALGSHIRCVVSVSMLTEGWDANTVTHIMGLRAFGSQLLCEQVAGRALRRRNYFIDPKTGKFPPEYAHIIGVPFKFFKGGESEIQPPLQYATLRALPERDDLEISFPNVVGYRIELDEGPLRADFSATPDYEINTTQLPVESILGSAFSDEQHTLEIRSKLEQIRDQQVIYNIAQQWMKVDFVDDQRNPRLEKFVEVRRIVEQWYEQKLKVIGETDTVYKRMLHYETPAAVIDSLRLGIAGHHAQKQQDRILPILNHYNKIGSTRHVFGHTSKPTYPTKRSHINLVVADTDSWEQIAAKTLETLPEVESYVKNAFLGFSIPYTTEGKERQYFPDFIARIKTHDDNRFNLLIEITGFNKDKGMKRWYVQERWLPAVNATRKKLKLDPWYFIEISDIERIKNLLTDEITRLSREVDEIEEMTFFQRVQASSFDTVWAEGDDNLFSD